MQMRLAHHPVRAQESRRGKKSLAADSPKYNSNSCVFNSRSRCTNSFNLSLLQSSFRYRSAVASDTCKSFSTSSLVIFSFVSNSAMIFSSFCCFLVWIFARAIFNSSRSCSGVLPDIVFDAGAADAAPCVRGACSGSGASGSLCGSAATASGTTSLTGCAGSPGAVASGVGKSADCAIADAGVG